MSRERPQDVIGLHFFSPANVMRLLEVVRGAKTAKDVLATAMRLAKTMGKVAVVSGVCDGFIGNRMLARYAGAAHDLLMAGALPQQIDAALQEFGMAMGPFRVGDLAGLDISWALRKRRAAEFPGRDFSNAADVLCEAGRFGQKTGAGWYRYEAGSRNPIPDPAVTAIIEEYRRKKGITARSVSSAEIVARCIYALINEGARIIEDGIAQRASDIDMVYLNGYGFPAYRGGPMFFADQTGLHEIARALKRHRGAARQRCGGLDARAACSPVWRSKAKPSMDSKDKPRDRSGHRLHGPHRPRQELEGCLQHDLRRDAGRAFGAARGGPRRHRSGRGRGCDHGLDLR